MVSMKNEGCILFLFFICTCMDSFKKYADHYASAGPLQKRASLPHDRSRSAKLSQHDIRHDKEITHTLQILDVKEKISTSKKIEDELGRGKSVSDSSLSPISVPVEKV